MRRVVCRVSPVRRCARVRSQWNGLIGLARLASVLALAFSLSGGSLAGEAKQQDFRKEPLASEDDLVSGNVIPLVDEENLKGRIAEMLRHFTAMGYSSPDVVGFSRKKMSYHVLVRAEEVGGKPAYYDYHMPPLAGEKSRPQTTMSEAVHVLLRSVESASNSISALAGFHAEPDPSRADILIYVNLADSLQQSTNFTREKMSRYVDRILDASARGKLRELVYVLPWTVMRVYYQAGKDGDGKLVDRIEGGEIWVEYPTRTFLQERLAQAILDNPGLAPKFGLGGNREQLVSKFVPPHLTPLASLAEGLSVALPARPRPRPGETLLSAAVRLHQSDELALAEAPAGLVASCSTKEHAQALGARIGRAMTIFASGFRLNGLILEDQSDYAAGFQQNPEQFLAEASLGTYGEMFDALLDDALAPTLALRLGVSTLSGERKGIAATLLRDRRPEIAAALASTAINLRTNKVCWGRGDVQQHE